ncbi:MAG: hypothetical protein JWO30_3728 [Fibrobacteres bacterium]|nr:hypothetical protein [Fibrobacterota bacterium]
MTMLAPGMHIEQRKGDPKKLKGKLLAYVRIVAEEGGEGPESYGAGEVGGTEPSSPLNAMVRNGILAVQANYVDQRNIRDFFRDEFGISLEKGIQEVIDQAKETGGLEGALDPEAVKERLESMKNADFIPIPAKIAFFNSEEEMLAADADVFFLGHFTVISHAHLCVNSFPIIYQAYFREQEHRAMEREIAALLGTIEDPKSKAAAEPAENAASGLRIQTFKGDLKAFLLKDLIPNMIYNLSDAAEYQKALHQFKSFMGDFGYPEDMQEIINLIESTPTHDAKALRKLELLVAKVEALQKEDYEKLEVIRKEIKGLP